MSNSELPCLVGGSPYVSIHPSITARSAFSLHAWQLVDGLLLAPHNFPVIANWSWVTSSVCHIRARWGSPIAISRIG